MERVPWPDGKAAERPAKLPCPPSPSLSLGSQVPMRVLGPVLALHLMAVFTVKVIAGREMCDVKE